MANLKMRNIHFSFVFLIICSFLASICQSYVIAVARFCNIEGSLAWGDSFSVTFWSMISLTTFKSFLLPSFLLELV